ncbi:hypothetical protein D9M68_424180 [compost metagenome]
MSRLINRRFPQACRHHTCDCFRNPHGPLSSHSGFRGRCLARWHAVFVGLGSGIAQGSLPLYLFGSASYAAITDEKASVRLKVGAAVLPRPGWPVGHDATYCAVGITEPGRDIAYTSERLPQMRHWKRRSPCFRPPS